jgi:hypothetical protein
MTSQNWNRIRRFVNESIQRIDFNRSGLGHGVARRGGASGKSRFATE